MPGSDCQYCDGVMYVKFHKQVFPQWLASDHHSANSHHTTLHFQNKTKSSPLAAKYSHTKLFTIYHIQLVNPNPALFNCPQTDSKKYCSVIFYSPYRFQKQPYFRSIVQLQSRQPKLLFTPFKVDSGCKTTQQLPDSPPDIAQIPHCKNFMVHEHFMPNYCICVCKIRA